MGERRDPDVGHPAHVFEISIQIGVKPRMRHGVAGRFRLAHAHYGVGEPERIQKLTLDLDWNRGAPCPLCNCRYQQIVGAGVVLDGAWRSVGIEHERLEHIFQIPPPCVVNVRPRPREVRMLEHVEDSAGVIEQLTNRDVSGHVSQRR